ncbi:MAG: class I SAM-dependent methyltransferase [Nitrospirota bacterium]
MKNYHLTWNKWRYLGLLIREYFLSAIGKTKEAYLVRFERDAMITRGTPEFILDYVGGYLKPGMRVLDIGCGDGYLLDQLKNNYAVQAVGVDYSPTRVFRAIRSGRCVARCDMHSLPFRTQSFDIAIASNILQQTLKPCDALKEWASMIKREGLLIIMLGDISDFKRRWITTAGQRWKVIGYSSQFRVTYSKSSLIDAIKDSNLHIEQLIECSIQASPDHWIALCRKGKDRRE